MAMPRVRRTLNLLLPLLLLVALLHGHAEQKGTLRHPRLSADEGPCPICAAVRGGMEGPAPLVHLPGLPAPAVLVVLLPPLSPSLAAPAPSPARGPPPTA
jgi:hypothetical protein